MHFGNLPLQVLLLSVVALSKGQHYDSDYNVADSDDDSAGYTADEQESPDYSKYFNSPGSAPQQEENSESGFVTPLDFQSFFGAPQGGFSSANIQDEVKSDNGFAASGFFNGPGLGATDYFEQAQKETKSVENTEQTPDYISSNIPTPGGYHENIENFRRRSEKFRPLPAAKPQEEEERQSYTNFKPSPVDSSPIKPTQPGYYAKYTQTPVASPYRKYSFQTQPTPIPYSPTYLKYTSPADGSYEYVPSQTVTQSARHTGCVKVNKKIPTEKFSKTPMTCYVCKDPKTGAQSEHCSYEQQPKAYYTSSSQSYNTQKPTRAKREDSEAYDPYEEVKARSHRYNSQPEEFADQRYRAPDFSEYEQYSAAEERADDDEEDEKSSSEKQSEELVKQKDSCQKIHKDGISCLVCKNAETGGNYEQCSYQSEPNEQKYAYVRESKYDGDNESDSPEGESEKYKEEVPVHFAKTTGKLRRDGVVGLDPTLYGRPESRKRSKVARQESKQSEDIVKPESYYDPTGKRDVERVLEEFSKKDRSNCEQVKKKGMTCYLCVDKKGIKHEECMYISESRPHSSLVAYHEKETVKDVDEPESESETRRKLAVHPKKVHETDARNKREKKRKPEPKPDIATEDGPKKDKRKRQEPTTGFDLISNSGPYSTEKKKQKKTKQREPDPKPEFDVNDEGGLYSAETKPVYVKALGLSLPKYMVEKTDYERDFDLSSSKGRK
uniref:Uncharacterized protein n=1 Tax=Photinus pyralis TaxID=7054 RepID=A0A1Y1KED6_PHOPY